MWLSGRSAQATKSSRYLSARGVPPLPHTSDGCGVIPTSATGWKYDPSAAPGYLRCASIAAALGANVTAVGVGAGAGAVVAQAAAAAATRVTLRIGCDPRDGVGRKSA